MRRFGISVIAHIVSISLLMLIFAAFDFDTTTIPTWVLVVTFVLGGITWDVIDEIDKL